MCSITGRFRTGTIGFGIVVGDRPQPGAEPGRQDHRTPHGRPIASLKRSIASTGSGSTPRASSELERDQVAEHSRPEQARDPGLARGLDPDAPAPAAATAAAVSSKRRRSRGC